MLGRETRVPKHVTYHVPAPESSVHDYVDELVKRMRTAHEVLREQQWQVRSGDPDDLPCIRWETRSGWLVIASGADWWLSYSQSLWVLIAWLRWCQIMPTKWNVLDRCQFKAKHSWNCTGRALTQQDRPLHS